MAPSPGIVSDKQELLTSRDPLGRTWLDFPDIFYLMVLNQNVSLNQIEVCHLCRPGLRSYYLLQIIEG